MKNSSRENGKRYSESGDYIREISNTHWPIFFESIVYIFIYLMKHFEIIISTFISKNLTRWICVLCRIQILPKMSVADGQGDDIPGCKQEHNDKLDHAFVAWRTDKWGQSMFTNWHEYAKSSLIIDPILGFRKEDSE